MTPTLEQISWRLVAMAAAGVSHRNTWHFRTRVFLSLATQAKSLKHGQKTHKNYHNVETNIIYLDAPLQQMYQTFCFVKGAVSKTLCCPIIQVIQYFYFTRWVIQPAHLEVMYMCVYVCLMRVSRENDCGLLRVKKIQNMMNNLIALISPSQNPISL